MSIQHYRSMYQTSADPPAFPYTWATDLSIFRRVVRAFDKKHPPKATATISSIILHVFTISSISPITFITVKKIPLKKWSRQEEEKKLKDIEESSESPSMKLRICLGTTPSMRMNLRQSGLGKQDTECGSRQGQGWQCTMPDLKASGNEVLVLPCAVLSFLVAGRSLLIGELLVEVASEKAQ